ncbi:MAG: hypothetical protein IPG93_03865 [Burkholderiales bacterium]|nr:hypothetical protein [Burkholderiales bacterium]
MAMSDGILLSVATLGIAAAVAWAATRHYRGQITTLLRELEEARAAAAHHALWSEEQRIELGRQVRALQTQVARLDALMQNEQKRASRNTWSLPIMTPGSTAAAAGPQLRPVTMSGTTTMPQRPLVPIVGGRASAASGPSRPIDDDIDHDLQTSLRRESELAPSGHGGAKSPAGEDQWREPQVAANTGYYSSRGGRLTIATGGIATSTEFDFAATQPINASERG